MRIFPFQISLLLQYIFSAFSFNAVAQDQRVITGSVHDEVTRESLPFVAVSLKKNLLATVTNEQGTFEFKMPADIKDDTLTISSIGYQPYAIALSNISGALSVSLKPSVTELKEVEILPMPPTYYIKVAMNKISVNYPDQPFETQSYYREKLSENNVALNVTEAVFKSYYPNYRDTSATNQHQLLLYNKSLPKKMQFMQKESKKTEEDDEMITMGEMMGGPDMILELDLVRGAEQFLDSNSFRYFEYTFGNSTTYNGRELMVIDFKSKRAVDKMRTEGRIYIDNASDAIVSIKYTGEMKFPVLVRPAMFVFGFGITRPEFKKELNYELIGEKWYPKTIQASMQATLTKKRMFSENERSTFAIEGIFAVNKIQTEGNDIPKPKRFSAEKKMEEQVFNDINISWPEVNRVE